MGKRILAVEDDLNILEMYSMFLEGEGYEVRTLLSPDNLAWTTYHFEADPILHDIQLARHFDANDILPKPFDPDTLKQEADSFLSAKVITFKRWTLRS